MWWRIWVIGEINGIKRGRKKAIEYLENRLDILHNNTQWATEKSIKVVLNLTKKQQREIKHQRQQRKYWRDIFYEQQKEIKELTLDLEEMTKSNNHKLENWVHKNILNSYISKDKIRELREIDNIDLIQFKIKELLEES